MKKALDRFSQQAGKYKDFRPKYPAALYREILRVTEGRNCCWDCGTGNGQVANELAQHFKQVYATDISEQQIREAEKSDNITYLVERAEQTNFKDDQFDLITAGQAIHWFDLDHFYKEVRRVGKNKGILAVWGYGLLRFGAPFDAHIDRFYREVTGPYWDENRGHIDQKYEGIGFNFPAVEISGEFTIKKSMRLDDLEGYLNSWSAVGRYIEAEKVNPVPEIIHQLRSYWNNETHLNALFPVFMKAGRIVK
ncbi:MAG TPA: class I SAM-dependent methyltransferase [Eudoraea sp.]|nr:class I SAM-dependent methyltransferase [Eudoraea sp.]